MISLISEGVHIHHFWYGLALIATGGWLGISYEGEHIHRVATREGTGGEAGSKDSCFWSASSSLFSHRSRYVSSSSRSRESANISSTRRAWNSRDTLKG